MASMTFVINDASTESLGTSPKVQVKITENADGTLTFCLTQLGGAGAYMGDLRGFFFDINEGLLGTLSVVNPNTTPYFTEAKFSAAGAGDTITDLGGGANMQGLLGTADATDSNNAKGYDAGIEIGTQGIGTDDVRSFTFTLDSSLRNLTLNDFINADFGVRLTSVGKVDANGNFTGSRNDSSKVLENAAATAGANATVKIDDDDVVGANGNPGGLDDDAPANTSGTLAHTYGGSGTGTTLLLGSGAPAGFTYVVTDGGKTLDVFQGLTNVVRITLSDTTSGNYTVTQLAAINHAPGGDENNFAFAINYQVTSSDGDTATGMLSIDVDDDTAVLKSGDDSSDTVTVEDEKIGGNDEDDGGVATVTANIVDNVNWGADGFGSATGFTVTGDATVFSTGTTVYWGQNGTFQGTTLAGAAASLSVASNGDYTYTILDNLLLGTDVQGEQIDTLATVSITGKDQDGDTQAVGVTLKVTDDIPLLKSGDDSSDTVTVEDEKIGGNDEDDGGVATVTANIVDNGAPHLANERHAGPVTCDPAFGGRNSRTARESQPPPGSQTTWTQTRSEPSAHAAAECCRRPLMFSCGSA